MTHPLSEATLLQEINAGLPELDWKAGARRYVQGFFDRYTREQIEAFIHTKPLAAVTPEDPAGSLGEDVSYLFNFASMLKLLALPRGSRVVDVACGGGWVSHWLMKLGYETTGFDISAEFVALARARAARDPDLHKTPAELDGAFFVHDIEADRLPASLTGRCDAVVLESCLHHFVDPVTVLRHLRETLSPTGVVLVIEGENRQGPVRDEYLKVMLETSTLERPYTRPQLEAALDLAGLTHRTFLGAVEGYAPEAETAWVAATFHGVAAGRNTCVCATSQAALRRVVPSYGDRRSEPVAAPAAGADGGAEGRAEARGVAAPLAAAEVPAPSALVHLATAVKLASPAWCRPLLARAWRGVRPATPAARS